MCSIGLKTRDIDLKKYKSGAFLLLPGYKKRTVVQLTTFTNYKMMQFFSTECSNKKTFFLQRFCRTRHLVQSIKEGEQIGMN